MAGAALGVAKIFASQAGSEEGPRISSETFRPLTPEDAQLFTDNYKRVIEHLTDAKKWYIGKATRDFFHVGKITPKTLGGFGSRGIRGGVPFALPQEED